MRHHAARLVIAVVSALAVRAADGQQVQPNGAPRGDIFKPGEIVARVGDTAIFYGDVAPLVNQIIDSELAKAKTPEQRRQVEEQIEASREALTRNVVGKLVEIKLKYLEFEREIRKNIADTKKRAEQLKRIDQSVRQQFEQHLAETHTKVAEANSEQLYELVRRDFIIPRLAMLMRDYKLESLGELDALLRRYGTTLDKQVRLYGEDQLGQSIVGKHVNKNHEATYDEMLDYYRAHASDYAIAAKARFEILTAKFANFPDRKAAENAIAQMGNAVFYGTEFAAVARKYSQEPHAASGGQYNWVTQGSLASEPVDRAIFTLEVGKLSQIIEDEVGYHIVRVTERQAAGQVSFVEAQEKIKKAIKLQKQLNDYKKYVETLHSRTSVWTIYDAPAVAQQPEQTMRR